jgi:asparagine synthase (glutamine-hydrolysing)
VADFVKFQRRDIHGETCYEGVTSFPRASWAWVEPGGAFRAEPYWSLPERRWSASQVPVEEASAQVEGLLREAVRIRLRADVPVCVQLSGGMDSSSTMALAAQEAGRINTYTVKFAEKDADEEPFARLAAGRYPDAVDYHVISPPDDDLIEHMDGYVHLMGEPFHSPNQFTSQRIWREMHGRGQRVVLYGAGGDEVFAGYVDDYYLPFLRHLARNGQVGRCVRELLLSSENSAGRHVAESARRLGRRVPGLRSLLDRRRRPPARDAFRLPEGVRSRAGPADDISGLLRDNMTDWRMSYWVRIDNQNSMGVPVELRCPFLDYRLVEYAFRLPLEYLIHDGWLKWILRRSMAPHLPPEIVWRRRKMGFPFPLPGWLRRRKAPLLSMLTSLDCPFVDVRRLHDHYDEMLARNARRLWCILSVGLWWKRCVQGQPLAAH